MYLFCTRKKKQKVLHAENMRKPSNTPVKKGLLQHSHLSNGINLSGQKRSKIKTRKKKENKNKSVWPVIIIVQDSSRFIYLDDTSTVCFLRLTKKKKKMPGGRQRIEHDKAAFKPLGVIVAFFEPAVCRYRPHLLASPDVSLSEDSEAVIVAPCAASPATTKWRVLDSSDGR